jgi:hypothetical protein
MSMRDVLICKLADTMDADNARELLNEVVREQASDLLIALRKAKSFIYYARYELQPGKAVLGDQFPKQEDADNVTALIDAALAKVEA